MLNVKISFSQINTAKGILDTILSVQPKESGSGKAGETREAIVFKIAEDMLRKLPRWDDNVIMYERYPTRTILWLVQGLRSPRGEGGVDPPGRNVAYEHLPPAGD